ncbi:hypothetical protein BCAR13_1560023 [Paraburkholderia caribensis]|nr:hypothetical protein BCAR13_1560023 [Paraburkholderia caribensis]
MLPARRRTNPFSLEKHTQQECQIEINQGDRRKVALGITHDLFYGYDAFSAWPPTNLNH